MNEESTGSSDLSVDYGVADEPAGQEATAALSAAETSSRPTVTFRGNNYDLMSVVGVTIGGVVLLSCATCNMGFYCLPLVPIALGAIGLAMSKESVDPDRTRLLSWLSLGAGAAIFALIFAGIALYIFFIIFAIAADSGGF
jgi:hypothetical protein